MTRTWPKKILHLLQYAVIASVLGVARFLPFDARGRMVGALLSVATRFIPPFSTRVQDGLRRIYPEMPALDRSRIAAEVGRNMGRTLCEILFNAEFAKRLDRFSASGPGLAVLEAAKADGKGAMIVSAHFGQWEAIRHVLKARGMETGAVYRRNNNPWYETHFRGGIEHGGAPIVPKGASGSREMMRHLKRGGFFAILADQYVYKGPEIAFLGHDAETTTAPADLALKYDLPLVPAFGLRGADGTSVEIEFEPPIPPSDPITMMRDFNDRVSRRIQAAPGQWYWLHRRWKRRPR